MNLAYRYLGTLRENDVELPVFENLEVYNKIKRQKLLSKKSQFENAVRLFDNKNYSEAKKEFKEILKYNKEDQVSYIYFSRCEENLKLKY